MLFTALMSRHSDKDPIQTIFPPSILLPGLPVASITTNHLMKIFGLITARKRSLGQGNIFRSVCQEFCPRGGHAWLRGACMVVGGMHGCWGVCMVAGGHAWLPWGVCGCARGCVWLQEACMVAGGCVVAGGHAWLWGAWLWGACMVAGGVHGCGGHAWLWGHAWLPGGVCGCQGACVVAWGHAWLLEGMRGCAGGVCGYWGSMHGCREVHGCGGMHGCWGCVWLWGACMVAGGCVWLWGACVVVGGHAWLPGGLRRIRRDTINERAVRILLECILVSCKFETN